MIIYLYILSLEPFIEIDGLRFFMYVLYRYLVLTYGHDTNMK